MNAVPVVALLLAAVLLLLRPRRSRVDRLAMSNRRSDRPGPSTWGHRIPVPAAVARQLRRVVPEHDAQRFWSSGLGGFVGLVLGAFVIGGPAAAGAVAVAGLVSTGLLWVLPSRERDVFDRGIPGFLDVLGRDLRGGRALGPSLLDSAESVPPPAERYEPLCRDLRSGVAPVEALRAWSDGSTHGVQMTVAALSVGTLAGASRAQAVESVASTLRSRAALDLEARALTSQARASAVVLAVAPLGFAAVAATIDPDVAGFLLTTPVGLACLVVGVLLNAFGAVWMSRMAAGR